MSTSKKRIVDPLRAWTIGTAIFLLLIWSVEHWGGERQFFPLVVSYSPQFLFAVPSVIVLIVSVIQKRRLLALANIAAIALATVFILGLHSPIPVTDVAKPRARIMTFNVEKWSHGVSQVASVIQSYHPDYFCLQEAGDFSYVPGHPQEEFEKLLPEYHFIRDQELVIGSLTPILTHRSYSLLSGEKTRPALVAEVKFLNHPVTIVAVHLLPMFMNDFHYIRKYGPHKYAQVNDLLTDLRPISTPIILCGDMNAQPPSETCHLLETQYTDAFDDVGRGFGYTIPAKFPISRLDHIYLGNGVVAQHAFVPNVIASDHRPFVADVVL